MEVIYRVKDNNIIKGYIVRDSELIFIPLNETYKYNPINVIRNLDGTWKARTGHRIKTISKEKYKSIAIENRNTHMVGKPLLIHATSSAKLSGTQRRILDELEGKQICTFIKAKDNIAINMKDLSALTAYTGLEYSLFERNDKYVVAKGTERGMYIKKETAAMLINNKFTWVGHTHPGTDFNCMMPSGADYETLKLFNQKRSMVYNSVGDFYIFGLEG